MLVLNGGFFAKKIYLDSHKMNLILKINQESIFLFLISAFSGSLERFQFRWLNIKKFMPLSLSR